MKAKALIPLVAGLAVGGFALKIGWKTLSNARGAETATAQIWVAGVDIARGTAIAEEMIKPLAYPVRFLPKGAVSDKEKLLGRVPRIDTPAELPILETNLLPPGERGGIYVKPGLRAVAVKIDEGSGVDFHLDPGCRVDVVGFFTIQRNNRQEKVARTIIENVEVAAVGARLSSVETEGSGNSSSGTRPTRAVTLLVKPENVKDLHLAEQQGKIKLSMRNDEDSGELTDETAISLDELLEGKHSTSQPAEEPLPPKALAAQPPASSAPVPEEPAPALPPGPPPWVVTVYRADQPELVAFRDPTSRERVSAEALLKQGSRPGTKTSRPDLPNWAAQFLRPAAQPPDPASSPADKPTRPANPGPRMQPPASPPANPGPQIQPPASPPATDEIANGDTAESEPQEPTE